MLRKTSEILCNVPLYIAQADGVSKYAAAALLGTSCGISQSSELNLFEHLEQLVRRDIGDRASSQSGKDVALEGPSGIFERVGGELTFGDARLQEFEPLACNDSNVCALAARFSLRSALGSMFRARSPRASACNRRAVARSTWG